MFFERDTPDRANESRQVSWQRTKKAASELQGSPCAFIGVHRITLAHLTASLAVCQAAPTKKLANAPKWQNIPVSRGRAGPPKGWARKRGGTHPLSWLDLPDDRWPSDYWCVGADLDPDLWPELWTFLAEGGG